MLWVFPTPVGVFLCGKEKYRKLEGLPHARGGVSGVSGSYGRGGWSSPRPWGCFPVHPVPPRGLRVFPTPVGVFPRLKPVACTNPVFPTPVGVFPPKSITQGRQKSLPHARGGVSGLTPTESRRFRSSPRPWGCFQSDRPCRHPPEVFPTPVGVFPG